MWTIGGTLFVLFTMPFVIWAMVAVAAKRDRERNQAQLKSDA
jgi:hypothetical protein